MKPLAFSSDVLDFLRVLARHQVRFLVIEGTAVIYQGYLRLTGDLDFLYGENETYIKIMD